MDNLTIDEVKQVIEYYEDEDFEKVSEILKDSSFNINFDELTKDEIEELDEKLEEKLYKILASKIDEKDYELLINDKEINKYVLANIIIATNNTDFIKRIIQAENEKLPPRYMKDLVLATKDNEFMSGIVADSNLYKFGFNPSMDLKEIIFATQDIKLGDEKRKRLQEQNKTIEDIILETKDIELIKRIIKGNNDFNKVELISKTKNSEFIKECIENPDYKWNSRELKELIIAINEPEYTKKWLDNKEDTEKFYKEDEAELIAATNDVEFIKSILKEKGRQNRFEILRLTGKKELIKQCIINNEEYGFDNLDDLINLTNDEDFIKSILKDNEKINRIKILKNFNNTGLIKKLIDNKEYNWNKNEIIALIALTKDSEYIKDKIQREEQEKKYGFELDDFRDLTIATKDKDLMKKFLENYNLLDYRDIIILLKEIDDDSFFEKFIIDNQNETSFPEVIETISLEIINDISDERKRKVFTKFKENGLKKYIFQYRKSKGIEYLKENIEQIMKIEGIDEKDIPHRKEVLMEMYDVNNEVLENIDFDLLQPNYIELLGLEKINQISCYSDIQEKVLDLNNNQLHFFAKCLDNNVGDRWTPLAQKILENISEYEELIENTKSAQDVNFEKINTIIQDKNVFGIHTIDDINNYEQIRRNKCNEWISSNDIELKKLAVLEKIYGQGLEYSNSIIEKYGQDIEVIKEGDLKEYVQSIKAIMSVEDSTILEEIFEECKEIETINKISIEEDLKGEYCKLYNKGLFSIEQANELEYGIYDAGTDFKMIITSLSAFSDVGRTINNYKDDWNRPAIATQHFCASYIRNDMMGTAPISNICYRIF